MATKVHVAVLSEQLTSSPILLYIGTLIAPHNVNLHGVIAKIILLSDTFLYVLYA